MAFFVYTSIWVLLATSQVKATVELKRQTELRRFPDHIDFGVATAAYQIEGGWNAGDKGENIWDYMVHNEQWRVDNEDNGDIAADSYNNWVRDAEMCAELGVNFYRFSISWSRILPTGFANYVSEDGVAYYNNLITELLKYNIKPVITIYHWDLPQPLQLLGGWSNPLIKLWFKDFARVAYEQFGDRVMEWITINEPYQICYEGYGNNVKAPALKFEGIADYLCSQNVLMAHAAAYHLYDAEYRPSQKGRIGLSISVTWNEPASDNEDDVLGAETRNQFEYGLYAHPVFSTEGDWPMVVKERVAAKSLEQGYPRSRLPEFTQQEIDYIKGTSDFFGLNHYTTRRVYRNASVDSMYNKPSFYDDVGTGDFRDPDWPGAKSTWLKVVPWGFRNILNFIKERYNSPEVRVYENGFSSDFGLVDDERISYYRQYLTELLNAVLTDNVNVTAYSAWSLMDNFEWMRGYSERFGLYEVDHDDPARKRTARKAALIYKEIIKSRVIDFDYEPQSLPISIDDQRKQNI